MHSKQKRSAKLASSHKDKATLPVLNDIFYCISLAVKALAQDEFSQCFQQKSPAKVHPEVSVRYGLGVAFRYGILFPFRVICVILMLIICLCVTGILRVFRSERLCNKATSLGCRVLLMCTGMHVRYIGTKPHITTPHVFVTNHTTYMDYLVVSGHKFSHAVIAQHQPGIMPLLLKLVSGSVEFERRVKSNRQQAKEKIKEAANKGSLLVFPEGTCVNNEYTVMFQKGAFDLNIPVCPAAIKYNKDIADPFWNTRKQSFSKHFMYLATRWRTEVTVWWMAPTSIERGETPSEFASRVKRKISERAGLKNLVWNGYLKHCTNPEEMKRMRLYGGPSEPSLHATIPGRK
ncbi:glycerol-3-phosphate O-acyltransferase 3/4 [Nematocida displodere]|uniref:Glycerol-3-phosphate O-acyltransferase 3/4 n=1 Tax=Nematocida displodere TaxID=1805483 RepID=A0A177EE50_9MICR|nr:glycerol-3-phosphate O-acyltransferase 3/4 [Nematocida displodere]